MTNPFPSPNQPKRILAVSGSLRAVSSNTTLLQAVAFLAAPSIEVTLYEGLADLPHFNPDSDGEGQAAHWAVAEFRARLNRAEAVIFSTPEYAHGVPGTLKNALDWVVGSGELSGKPVALFNASARGIHAQASLLEVLTTMDAQVIREACVTVPLRGQSLEAAEIAQNEEFAAPLHSALAALFPSRKSMSTL